MVNFIESQNVKTAVIYDINGNVIGFGSMFVGIHDNKIVYISEKG